jgi:hypothetical protein
MRGVGIVTSEPPSARREGADSGVGCRRKPDRRRGSNPRTRRRQDSPTHADQPTGMGQIPLYTTPRGEAEDADIRNDRHYKPQRQSDWLG